MSVVPLFQSLPLQHSTLAWDLKDFLRTPVLLSGQKKSMWALLHNAVAAPVAQIVAQSSTSSCATANAPIWYTCTVALSRAILQWSFPLNWVSSHKNISWNKLKVRLCKT